MSAVLAVAVFIAAYVLIATERVHRVKAALLGAGVMAALGIVDAENMFFSEETGVDWNVIFLLLGMMIIISVLRQTGIFEYLAIWAAKRAQGRPYRLLVMLIVITAVASALLDNVTTVLLIAPVTILLTERIGTPAVPFLIAEVLASNIGGTATLIGDPPNIIIGSRAGLSFNEFVTNLGPIVLVLLGIFVLMSRWLFRGAFHYDPERAAEVMALEEREAISDPVMLRRSLVVLAGVMLGFILHSSLHMEPSVVALLGAGVIVLATGTKPEQYLAEVEWATLVFFMGLFIMVGALVETGVIGDLGELATDAVGDHYLIAATGLLFGSALLSGFVDNIPYVATMVPLVEDLVATAPDATSGEALWWSLALGADLGGNATAVGASANVVVLGMAARSGSPISFWQFTKYGALVTLVTVLAAWPYIALRYFILA